MPDDPIASRYAQALFESAKAQGQLDETLEQLSLIGRLLHEQAPLRQFLHNPDVDPGDKVDLLGRVLQGSWSPLTRSFIHMVVSMGRAEFLGQIVQAFSAAVDRERGELRVTIRCAHPLPEAVMSRLRTRLEHRERRHVHLKTEVAPELIGGLQVMLDHRVIDGSVRRHLDELRQQLKTIRVY